MRRKKKSHQPELEKILYAREKQVKSGYRITTKKKKINKRRGKTITEAILVKWGHPQVVRFIFEGSSQSEQKVDRLKVFKSYI